ncbi:hypothetical protein R1flu_021460 [Riccia fluitans]|uniref:Uncharacterized protein n=1 Tax=Riccia fluitans TaxID=41844 RepID=A0ABD1ZQK6_9MARC
MVERSSSSAGSMMWTYAVHPYTLRYAAMQTSSPHSLNAERPKRLGQMHLSLCCERSVPSLRFQRQPEMDSLRELSEGACVVKVWTGSIFRVAASRVVSATGFVTRSIR